MIRNLIHLLAVLCLVLGLAGWRVWVAGTTQGDHIGWKRPQPDGRDWVEEMSARSYAGRLVLVSSARPPARRAPAR